MTEAKVLNGKLGGFDCSALLRPPPGSPGQHRLEVDTDGPQHFSKGMHSTTPQQQRAADRRKDRAAWNRGRRVVRLHHADEHEWAEKIGEAVRLANSPTYRALLLYTSSYNKLDRKQHAKVGGQAGRARAGRGNLLT
jgi:hypothetical protein